MQKNSRPNHPTTCGKIERFHQTQKRWFKKQEPPQTIEQLQTMLNKFTVHYNTKRPHQSNKNQTPKTIYNLTPKAEPDPNHETQPHYRIRKDTVCETGKVTLRHNSKLHHIGIGRTHKNKQVTLLINNLKITIIETQTGQILRKLELDPTRNYQPQNP